MSTASDPPLSPTGFAELRRIVEGLPREADGKFPNPTSRKNPDTIAKIFSILRERVSTGTTLKLDDKKKTLAAIDKCISYNTHEMYMHHYYAASKYIEDAVFKTIYDAANELGIEVSVHDDISDVRALVDTTLRNLGNPVHLGDTDRFMNNFCLEKAFRANTRAITIMSMIVPANQSDIITTIDKVMGDLYRPIFGNAQTMLDAYEDAVATSATERTTHIQYDQMQEMPDHHDEGIDEDDEAVDEPLPPIDEAPGEDHQFRLPEEVLVQNYWHLLVRPGSFQWWLRNSGLSRKIVNQIFIELIQYTQHALLMVILDPNHEDIDAMRTAFHTEIMQA